MAIFIALVIALSLSPIQTSIAKYVVATVNEKFGVELSLDKVHISPLGYVELEGLQVNDHYKNLLAHIGLLKTTFSSIANTASGQIELGDTSFRDVTFDLNTYRGESDTALDILIKSLLQYKKEEGSDKPIDVNISSLELENIKIIINDENENQEGFKLEKINAEVENIIVRDTLIEGNIKNLSMNTPYGEICDFKAEVISDMNKFSFKKMLLQTNASEFRGDMFYKIEDKKGEQFYVNLRRSKFYLGDLSFLGINLRETVTIDMIAGGNIDRIDISKLNLMSKKSYTGFKDLVFEDFVQGLKKIKMSGTITKSNFDKGDMNYFLKLFNQKPLEIDFLEYAKVNGDFRLEREHLETNLKLQTNIAKADFKVNIKNLYSKKNSKYKGVLNLFEITLDNQYAKNFNDASLKFTFSGKSFLEDDLQGYIYGVASGVYYKKHKYESLVFTANLKDKELKAFLKTEDEVLDAKINLTSKMVEKVNSLKVVLDVQNAEIHELFDILQKGKSKFKVELNLNTYSANNFWGVLDFSEIEYRSRDSLFQFNDFQVYGMLTDKTKFVEINSEDFISGQLNGDFKLNQVVDIATNAFTKVYSNHKLKEVKEGQEINFHCNIHNKFFEAFFPGISVSDDTKLQGYLLSEEGKIYFNLESSSIDFYGTSLKNINLVINNRRSNSLHIYADEVFNSPYKFSNVRMFNTFDRDTLFLKTTFDGENLEDDMGALNFYFTLNSEDRYVLGFKPSIFRYNKNDWYANKQNNDYNKVEISRDYDSIYVKDITLEHDYERINLNAFLSNRDTKIDASISNVNIGNIFPKGLFGYMVTGVLSSKLHYYDSEKYANEVLGSLSLDGLNIDGLNIGNLSSYMSSENLKDKINVYASIKNNYEESFSLGGYAMSRDGKTELDIDAFMDRFSYRFIDPNNEIVSKVRGFATGNLKIKGFLESPDISGDLIIDEGGIKIPYINVDFGFKDGSKVHIEDSSISAENVEIFETGYNTKFRGDGTVSYINFQNWTYDIEVFSEGVSSVFMNTSEKNNDYFYGVCYAKGKASLKGQEDDLVLDVEATLDENTKVTIPIKDEIMSVDNTFVKIKQKGEKVKKETKSKQKEIEATYKGMDINVALNLTSKALLEISMKGTSQLRVNSYGSGRLLMKSNLDGDFQIFGNYVIERGSYGLNYLTLIDKEFKMVPGGSIAWEGDIFEGIMTNVRGVYSLEANPDLLTGDTKFNRSIETNVIMDLQGPLLHPNTKFDITFPRTASYLKSDLTFYLSDEQQRQIQALSLLARGGFLSQAETDVRSNLSEGASKLVSSFFKDENSKVDMGVSYEITSGGIGSLISRDRVGLSMSTEILNKVKFNGKVGVPVTGFNTSVVAAEGEIEVPINKEGSLTTRIFNRRSEFQDFLSIDQNYTRGVGISYDAEFNSFREVFNKIFANKREEEIQDTEEIEKEKK